MSDKRQQILEAMEDIPKTITMIEQTLENFDSDQTLSDLTVELYLKILKTIEGMMQWLVDKTGCECGSILLPFYRMLMLARETNQSLAARSLIRKVIR